MLVLLPVIFLQRSYAQEPLPIEKSGTRQTATTTVLGISGSRFTLNGTPVFLLGFSYYSALGAGQEVIRTDLQEFQKLGFNWLRVWATWRNLGMDVSAVNTNGSPREPFVSRLKWLVEECDRRGLVVDVTLTRSRSMLPDFAAHLRATQTLLTRLTGHRNWYLDLANERDVRDDRYVPIQEIKALCEQVHQLDPKRLVTASSGGHDLSMEDIRESLAAGLDFLCPHRPRSAQSPAQTEAETVRCSNLMKELGHVVPLQYQEPFRRGYLEWEPVAADFLRDLRGALAGGAAGWCFHNGQQRNSPDSYPRRSFDLRSSRLFDQLDAEEQQVVKQAHNLVTAWDVKARHGE